MKNPLEEMFNFAEREKKKRKLKKLRGGDAEPIDKDAEIDLFCPKHGLQHVEHARFEKITRGGNKAGDEVMFARSKDHENPLRFALMGGKDLDLASEMYDINYTASSEGSRRMGLFMALIGIMIISFQQIWILTGTEIGKAFSESLMFNRMFTFILGGIAIGGATLYWFSKRTNFHYLPLVCMGEHEGEIHQCAVPGRENFDKAMALFYNSEKNVDAIEMFSNIRKNFDQKIEELNDELDEQVVLREEMMEQNLMRQGMETARALRSNLDEDFMTGKDVALWSVITAVITGLVVYVAVAV